MNVNLVIKHATRSVVVMPRWVATRMSYRLVEMPNGFSFRLPHLTFNGSATWVEYLEYNFKIHVSRVRSNWWAGVDYTTPRAYRQQDTRFIIKIKLGDDVYQLYIITSPEVDFGQKGVT